MRIMMVSPLPPPSGGIAAWTQRYTKAASAWDLQVHIVNTAIRGKRAMLFSEQYSLCSEIKRTLSILGNVWKLSRKEKPQVMHINSSCSPIGIMRDWICMMIVSKKCKKVLHCRCTTKDQLGDNRLGKHFFAAAVKKADIVLVLNEVSQKHVEEIRLGCVQKMPNFIDVDFLRTDPKPIADTIHTVLFTGHVLKTKGVDELLEVARMHPDIVFKVAGSMSEDYRTISRPENVQFLGNVSHEEIRQLLDEADVFLFPSYTEGFSNSLVEAMARGVPVLATDVGANRDMVEDRGGFIIPPKDAQAISNALNVLTDRELRRSMSEWNQIKVKNCYTLDSVMTQLVSVYQSMFK